MADAAIEAGYSGSRETARVEAHRTLQKPHVVAAMEKALDDAGATLEASARVIREAHAAKKDGKQADHALRLKAAELNFKARGMFTAKSGEEAGQLFSIGYFIAKGQRERGLPDMLAEEGQA